MLHVEEVGQGEPVVILNGYPVRVDHLRPLAERLGGRRRAMLVHLPGYGKSEPLRPYDAAKSHALVEDALIERGVSEPSIVGYSFGLHRALAIALRGRVRARAIVGLAGASGYEPAQAAGFRELAKTLTSEAQLASILESIMLSERAQKRPELVAEVRSWAGATSIENLREEVFSLTEEPDLLPRIPSLDLPMLLRVGTDDVAALPGRSRQIAEVARRSKLEEVEGVGHLIAIEDLDGTVASIERFLDDVERPTS